VFLLCVVAGCKGYEPNRRTYSDDNIQWGPAVDGLKVGLARREYEPGYAPPGRGMINLSVHLLNESPRPLTILAPAAIRGALPEDLAGDESVAVKLLYDAAGQGAKTGEFKPIKKPQVQVMEPGKVYILELRVAPEKFGMSRFVPGRITAVYVNRQASIRYTTLDGQTVTGMWTGEARSGTIVLGDPELAATTQPTAGGSGEKK
jgi:hypothetical protein